MTSELQTAMAFILYTLGGLMLLPLVLIVGSGVLVILDNLEWQLKKHRFKK